MILFFLISNFFLFWFAFFLHLTDTTICSSSSSSSLLSLSLFLLLSKLLSSTKKWKIEFCLTINGCLLCSGLCYVMLFSFVQRKNHNPLLLSCQFSSSFVFMINNIIVDDLFGFVCLVCVDDEYAIIIIILANFHIHITFVHSFNLIDSFKSCPKFSFSSF